MTPKVEKGKIFFPVIPDVNFIEDKKTKRTNPFFYDVSEFPKFPNPYDSLGEAYFINKEYELAIKNYKISLELNPENTAAAEMIAKIEKLIQ